MLLSLIGVEYAIYDHLDVKHIVFKHNSHVTSKNTLFVKESLSRSEKHFAHIYHHLEVKHIVLKHNSHVTVKNTLFVKKVNISVPFHPIMLLSLTGVE